MKINCVWEHNGDDTLLYAIECVGAFTRGENLNVAIAKMPDEILSYFKWLDKNNIGNIEIVINDEKSSALNIRDADSDVLFECEKKPLTKGEYLYFKDLALKSAESFLTLYQSIPDKNIAGLPERKTFYGQIPRSANEMYEHTKNVNEYYFAVINVGAANDGDIYECRKLGFELLESADDFLKNTVFESSYGESWSLRKVIRRFIWHDRIHAKAMYRMATKAFGRDNIANPFYFSVV